VLEEEVNHRVIVLSEFHLGGPHIGSRVILFTIKRRLRSSGVEWSGDGIGWSQVKARGGKAEGKTQAFFLA
jgi:hypothetical protein